MSVEDAPYSADDASQKGQIIAGSYELGEVIGEGAMGKVYSAICSNSGERIAVKLLRRDLMDDATIRARFLREAELLASLPHPNIVRLLKAGELEDGRLYIAMECVDGIRLDDALGNRAMSQEFTLELARQIGSALTAAHAKGVIHRDVKPQNIFLTALNGQLHFKLFDFGLSRPTQTSDLTAENAICGTPLYLSPEQSLGRTVSERSDFYSLGVVLYQTLSGQPPFRFRSLVQLLVAHAEATPPPLSATSAHASPAIIDWIESLLVKAPEDRPASGEDVVIQATDLLTQVQEPGHEMTLGESLDISPWAVGDATQQDPAESSNPTVIDGAPMWSQFAQFHDEAIRNSEDGLAGRAARYGWSKTLSGHFQKAMSSSPRGRRFAVALVLAINSEIAPERLASRIASVTSNAIDKGDLKHLTQFVRKFLNGVEETEVRNTVARLMFNDDNLERTMRLMRNTIVEAPARPMWSGTIARCSTESLGRVVENLMRLPLENAELFTPYVLKHAPTYGGHLGHSIALLPEEHALGILRGIAKTKAPKANLEMIAAAAVHPSENVRLSILETLSLLFGEDAIPVLVKLGQDPVAPIREGATPSSRHSRS